MYFFIILLTSVSSFGAPESFLYEQSSNNKKQLSYAGFSAPVSFFGAKAKIVQGRLQRFVVASDADFEKKELSNLSIQFKKDDLFFRSKQTTSFLIWLLDLNKHPHISVSLKQTIKFNKQYKQLAAITNYQKKNHKMPLDIIIHYSKNRIKANVSMQFDPKVLDIKIPALMPASFQGDAKSFLQLDVHQEELIQFK